MYRFIFNALSDGSSNQCILYILNALDILLSSQATTGCAALKDRYYFQLFTTLVIGMNIRAVVFGNIFRYIHFSYREWLNLNGYEMCFTTKGFNGMLSSILKN